MGSGWTQKTFSTKLGTKEMRNLDVDLEFEAPPKALDPASFVDPPNWVVRQISTNFGKAGQKYPSGWLHAPTYDPRGPWGFQGTYEDVWEGLGEQVDNNSKNPPPKHGNLKEEHYRFWNGTETKSSDIAVCRWCHKWCYGKVGMERHQDETDHTKILRAIYEFARKRHPRYCFVCNVATNQERWGIPMHTSSNKCVNEWRVGRASDLDKQLLFYFRLAQPTDAFSSWINKEGHEIRNHSTT